MTTTEALNIEPQGLTRVAQELLDNSGFLLARLGFAAKARALEEFDRLGYAAYHYGVLALLDQLEQRGLIERHRDPSDRRRHVVSLTADGKRELVRLRGIAKQVEEEFLAPLDAADRETFHTLLMRLAIHHDPRCEPL